jgi:hypothetical protein
MDRHHHADSPNSGVVVKKRKQEEEQVTKTLSFQFHDFLVLWFSLFNSHFSRILIVIVDHLNFMKFCVFFVFFDELGCFLFRFDSYDLPFHVLGLYIHLCLVCNRIVGTLS